MEFLRKLTGTEEPVERTLWHPCRQPLFPRRTVDGEWIGGGGKLWRRWRHDRWEYRQDPETDDEYFDRQI